MGDACLETNIGCRLLLKYMRHVLDIGLYLIFACVLDDESYSICFGKGTWKLIKYFLVVAKGKKAGFFILQVNVCSGKINAAEETSINLWHR